VSAAPVAFEYALLRAVPRVDRGECVNVGVLLYCQAHDFLGARVHLDASKVLALDPDADLEVVTSALDALVAVCAGDPEAGAPARLPVRKRFGWLTAPRSTVVQPGPVHCGLTASPDGELDRLTAALVR
jgi:hypothetical protein